MALQPGDWMDLGRPGHEAADIAAALFAGHDAAMSSCSAFTFARTRAISPRELVKGRQEIAFTPDARLTANSLPLRVSAAAKGIGVAFAVEGLVAPYLDAGNLVRVLEVFCPSYEPLHLYWSGYRLIPPKPRAFIAFVKSRSDLLHV